ncbi:DUF4468 domain-containing protein [Chryseobacterium bernardetii]|uniref:DUF4468 domain-containing protein n=1 Tax=Chryseobacterium bernardetii TaxID=1241978 RepID=A0A3G6TAL5_9FLAO|nr:DUF4468 domain-containing protein [Chryseobacterium bernardetii]AZB23656.1 DUF4468 domain-containing protein [Chryseobacterium bernardetii]
MKQMLIFLLFILSYFFHAQELQLVDGDYTYTKVLETNKSKIDTYKTLKKWLNNSSTKSKYVIDQDDFETGLLSFNETLPEREFIYLQTSQVSYKVNIEIKDNKIRFRVNNIILKNNIGGLASFTQSYAYLITNIEKENSKYEESKKLMDGESKPRIKKKYEYDFNNARNNLRSLTELDTLIKNQILFNQNLIMEKLNENDDW